MKMIYKCPAGGVSWDTFDELHLASKSMFSIAV